MGTLVGVIDFIVERPALAGMVVYGTLYLLRSRRRRSTLSRAETEHALQLYESERKYADTMYDPLKPEEEAATKHRFAGAAR